MVSYLPKRELKPIKLSLNIKILRKTRDQCKDNFFEKVQSRNQADFSICGYYILPGCEITSLKIFKKRGTYILYNYQIFF